MKTKGTKNKRIKLPHGDGSIYFIESRNRYAGQVTLMIDGDKLRKTVYGKTEKEVKDKIRELHIQAQAGNLHNPKKPKPLTIYDLADKMIEEQLMLNEIRQSSYDRKKSTLKMLSAISDMEIKAVTEEDVIAFFSTILHQQDVSAPRRCIQQGYPQRYYRGKPYVRYEASKIKAKENSCQSTDYRGADKAAAHS